MGFNYEKVEKAWFKSKNTVLDELEEFAKDTIINFKANPNADEIVRKTYELGVKDFAQDIIYEIQELKKELV